jgi:hypothetical protein
MRIGDPMVGKNLHPDRHCQFMVRAVNRKDAMDLHRETRALRHLTFDVVRTKDDLRVFRGLKNVFVHAAIAAVVSALTGASIDHEYAAHTSVKVVVRDLATLELKRSVHGVQNVPQREFDACVCGGKPKPEFVGLRSGSDWKAKQSNQRAKGAAPLSSGGFCPSAENDHAFTMLCVKITAHTGSHETRDAENRIRQKSPTDAAHDCLCHFKLRT